MATSHTQLSADSFIPSSTRPPSSLKPSVSAQANKKTKSRLYLDVDHAAFHIPCNALSVTTGLWVPIDHALFSSLQTYWDQSGYSSMSQPSTPFDDTTSDPFLPSHDLDKQLSQSDFHGLFGSNASDQAAFSAINREVLDGLDFTYGGVTLTPVASSNPSTVLTTPDFSTYSFSQQSPTYPTPGSGTPYPYPVEFHQTYETTGNQQAFSHRPLPVRSHTNNAHIHPTQPSPSCHRRRSLSHGEAERIAATA